MSERHNVFIEKINKIAFNSNDDKRMESIDLTETYIIKTGYKFLTIIENIKNCKLWI